MPGVEAITARNSAGYDAPIGLTADPVVFTLAGDRLSVLLARRLEEPQRGSFALPGGFVGAEETPAQTAERKLREKTGVGSVHLEQLRTYAEPGRDPLSDLDALEAELGQYEGTFGALLAKPRIVALNKIDVPEARELAELVRPSLEARGLTVFEISAVAHDGLRALTFALAGAVEADRAARPPVEARIVLHPKAVDDTGFTVEPDPEEPDDVE